MAVFRYSAKDLQGEYHKGEIETVNESQAVNLLRHKKLIVISIKTAGSEHGFFDSIFNRVSFSDVVVMTRQLATMVGAGLVLSESLDILQEQQANKKFKEILGEISTDVKGGLDFATAIEKYPGIFPNLYAKLVRAGQSSGKLDTILVELATNLEKEREFKSRIKGAMIYPIVVITMMVGVMLLMVFFVMPKLLGMYKDSGMDLPLPTKIVLTFSDIMISFWWVALGLIVLAIFAFRRFVATSEGRLTVDKLILKTPVLGKVTSVVIMTNFTRTFALLVAAGISILEAIHIVSNITGNLVYKSNLEIAYKGVERGLAFSDQLLGLPIFPKIVGQMVKIGEETGKLDEIVMKLSDYFESEADNSLKNITTLIEPIVLVVLGLGVAFLVVSIILPIYQLTANIK